MSESGAAERVKIPLIKYKGVPFPGPPFDIERVEKVVKFKPDPDDIFVVTYPKCGTTWTQFIVWEIMNEGAPPPSPNIVMLRDFPFLEISGVDIIETLPLPRTMKTHLPFQLQPYNPTVKYIYVVRNPWDCCVSYYHHSLMDPIMAEKLKFDDFFELFITGEVPFGDFFDHVLSWYPHRNDPNVLYLTYEEMKRDPRETLFTLAKFLGDHYHEVLEKDESIVENCLKHSSFKYMKDLGFYIPKDLPKSGEPESGKDAQFDKDAMKKMMELMANIDMNNVDLDKYKKTDFFRKGLVGDWRNYFTEDQRQRFNVYVSNKLQGTEMEGYWKPLIADTEKD